MDATQELTVYVKQTSMTHPLPAGSTLRVGRGSRVHIRVDDQSVSREHILLHVGQAEVHVEDLGSSNGTQLYRSGAGDQLLELKAHERHSLRPGDVLRVGSVPIILQPRRVASGSEHATVPPSSSPNRVLRDPEMQRVYDLATRAAVSDIGVLVTGETGAGKEILATLVHSESPRAKQPFMQINCAAFAESLLESELFGHERGAFTGAHATRVGLLESARGGTVFLDEIGEMPLSLQAKVLRVIEERLIRRVGSSKTTRIDVRFVAATNRDLQAEVAAGRFRGDLYYRISGIVLRIPPLRERTCEIEPLARHFLHEFCVRSGIATPEIRTDGVRALLDYTWPGNVRELKNVMERAPFLSSGAPLGAEHFPAPALADIDDAVFEEERTDIRAVPDSSEFAASSQPPGFRRLDSNTDNFRRLLDPAARISSPVPTPRIAADDPTPSGMRRSTTDPLPNSASSLPVSRGLRHGNAQDFSKEEEKQQVIEALAACSGNQTRAARMLGVSRRTLINRIEAFGIPRPRK